MLQRLVANWLKQHAQEAFMQRLRPGETAGDATKAVDDLPPTVEIACFYPTVKEAAGLTDLLSSVSTTQCNGFVERIGTVAEKRIAIIEATLPHEQLALVVRDVISLRKPKWIFATGFAMATDPSVSRGHLLVANRIVDARDYSLSIDTKMAEARGLRVGTLSTVADKAIKEATAGALAQDSQAAVIGEVCRVLKTKMMAVHCVAATLNTRDNPVAEKIKSQGSIAGIVGAAAGALLDQPSSLKHMWKDKEANLVFSDRLAKFLVSMISQLP